MPSTFNGNFEIERVVELIPHLESELYISAMGVEEYQKHQHVRTRSVSQAHKAEEERISRSEDLLLKSF